MYLKFFRWATDRLDKRDGLVCFVSNNSFLTGISLDGFREHLLRDFHRIYHFDLKGDARTSGERRRQEGGNIFSDQIREGVGVTLLIRKAEYEKRKVFYHAVEDYATAEEKREYIAGRSEYSEIDWQLLRPDTRNSWITEGLSEDFDGLIAMGSKQSKALSGLDAPSIFKKYSLGVSTNRDRFGNHRCRRRSCCSWLHYFR